MIVLKSLYVVRQRSIRDRDNGIRQRTGVKASNYCVIRSWCAQLQCYSNVFERSCVLLMTSERAGDEMEIKMKMWKAVRIEDDWKGEILKNSIQCKINKKKAGYKVYNDVLICSRCLKMLHLVVTVHILPHPIAIGKRIARLQMHRVKVHCRQVNSHKM